jgi:hypothetical protein
MAVWHEKLSELNLLSQSQIKNRSNKMRLFHNLKFIHIKVRSVRFISDLIRSR